MVPAEGTLSANFCRTSTDTRSKRFFFARRRSKFRRSLISILKSLESANARRATNRSDEEGNDNDGSTTENSKHAALKFSVISS
ncbi:hypothetical protein PILCRDRAFT_822493 [Piloderma croceum F 1598]|uniref:Uncharacterized protein n=1 Tax=Piloderma croceum (strain F 1598) TaxID=765440 RepID=A0A0C3FKA6_PILCF|nr:hypothetical protein PILCRDRAFT_822493 [Piloderma croceum F 1598]